MKACGIFAASLFGALAAAAPVNKRDIVWVTETNIDIVTVPFTKTVWVGADEAEATSTSAAVAHAQFAHPTYSRHTFSSSPAAPASTSTSVSVVPTTSSSSSVYIAPTSSSVYVEPTTSSSSVYVAPSTSSVYVAPTSSSVYVAPTTSSVYVAPTTSSVYVAPTTSSTSVYVAPTTSSTSVYVAPTTSSTSVYVAATTTSTPPSTCVASSVEVTSTLAPLSGLAASGTSYSGDLTWYATGSGACGWVNTSCDHIVAISHLLFDDAEYVTGNPNANPLCGRQVSITGKDGTAYVAQVVDRCTGCAESDLDLSEDFFNTVTKNGDGRVSDMSWTWV